MERHDELDTSENVRSWPTNVASSPTIGEIELRLLKLGCTKEQVKRHVDQVALSRSEAAREKLKPGSSCS
jgi:hypothetical protein